VRLWPFTKRVRKHTTVPDGAAFPSDLLVTLHTGPVDCYDVTVNEATYDGYERVRLGPVYVTPNGDFANAETVRFPMCDVQGKDNAIRDWGRARSVVRRAATLAVHHQGEDASGVPVRSNTFFN